MLIELSYHQSFNRDIMAKRSSKDLSVQAKNIFDHFNMSEDIVACFDCKNRDMKYSLLSSFHDYIEIRAQEVVSGTMKLSTLKTYRNTYSLLKGFLSQEYVEKDISINQVTRAFIVNFDTWIQNNTQASVHSRQSYLLPLRVFLKQRLDERIIDHNPFDNYRFRRPENKIVYLTEKEMSDIRCFKSTNKLLEDTRDVFMFLYNTGISYIDYQALTAGNLVVHAGFSVLSGKRKKTGTEYLIPLSFEAKYLMEKFKSHELVIGTDKLAPVYKKGVFNRRLKLLAKNVGIEKNITAHVARHSFATSALAFGVPITTIQKVLGHRHLQSTLIYANLIDLKIYNDMELFNTGVMRQMSTNFSHPRNIKSNRVEIEVQDRSWLAEKLANKVNDENYQISETNDTSDILEKALQFNQRFELGFIKELNKYEYIFWSFFRLNKADEDLFLFIPDTREYKFSAKKLVKEISCSYVSILKGLKSLDSRNVINLRSFNGEHSGYYISINNPDYWDVPLVSSMAYFHVRNKEIPERNKLNLSDSVKEKKYLKYCKPSTYCLLNFIRIKSRNAQMRESIREISEFLHVPNENVWNSLNELHRIGFLHLQQTGPKRYRIKVIDS
jgi:site-specific recombinase XerD